MSLLDAEKDGAPELPRHSADSSRSSFSSLSTQEELEAQKQGLVDASTADQSSLQQQQQPLPPEYTVPTKTKLLYLSCWFTLNLILTLMNKALLSVLPFPWLLTTVHATFVSLGCFVLLMCRYFTLTPLKLSEHFALVAFSFLFTINIAISNVSLEAVSVPFHQIMRSTCPVFTILIYRLYFHRNYSNPTYLSLIPVIIGVAMATFGDYYFTTYGFLLTLLGVVLASVKTVLSNQLMTGKLALPALEVLLRMSPLAAVQSILYSVASGELQRLRDVKDTKLSFGVLALLVIANGSFAFLLNIVSLNSNKVAGALSMTVAGNLKQTLTILLGIVLFNVRVTALNGVGMFITLIGGAIYSKVELDTKGKR